MVINQVLTGAMMVLFATACGSVESPSSNPLGFVEPDRSIITSSASVADDFRFTNQVDVEQFAQALNQYRNRNGRTTLRSCNNLIRNAAENNRRQLSRGLGHHYMGPGTARQNSAYNYGSIAAVMQGWHNSSGHRVHLLAEGVGCFGIHWHGAYWTLDLGRCSHTD